MKTLGNPKRPILRRNVAAGHNYSKCPCCQLLILSAGAVLYTPTVHRIEFESLYACPGCNSHWGIRTSFQPVL